MDCEHVFEYKKSYQYLSPVEQKRRFIEWLHDMVRFRNRVILGWNFLRKDRFVCNKCGFFDDRVKKGFSKHPPEWFQRGVHTEGYCASGYRMPKGWEGAL